jgi:hypothetical protein
MVKLQGDKSKSHPTLQNCEGILAIHRGQSWTIGSRGRVVKDQSTTKTPFRSFAGREIQRKEVQTRDMRIHEKIWTVRSPRIVDR